MYFTRKITMYFQFLTKLEPNFVNIIQMRKFYLFFQLKNEGTVSRVV